MTNFDIGVIIKTDSALSGIIEADGGVEKMKITLEAARVNAGLVQKEAAAMLGVSNKTLSSWENGISFPDAQQIEKICELYVVSYDNINFLPNNPL